MAVPCGDERDHAFANYFSDDPGMPEIKNIFKGVDISESAYSEKDDTQLKNSDFLNGESYTSGAVQKAIDKLEEIGKGYGKTNYRLRDAVFSRQRYWGEPIPIYYKDGLPQAIDKKHLPLLLPEVDEYLPTEDGQPPLGRATKWFWDEENCKVVSRPTPTLTKGKGDSDPNYAQGSSEHESSPPSRRTEGGHTILESNITSRPTPTLPKGKGDSGASRTQKSARHESSHPLGGTEGGRKSTNRAYPLELNTMPGWAGSSWYMFRYMDAENEDAIFDTAAQEYWHNVDLYIGGSEHATGHLLYSRFWTKFLFDRQKLTVNEPFKKMINQGMILGESAFINELEIEAEIEIENTSAHTNTSTKAREVISAGLREKSVDYRKTHAPVFMVNTSNGLDIAAFKKWRPDLADVEFITEVDGTFKVSREVEKMSKSKFNVVNPDDICDEYGADTLRLYEMFLGPLEQAKPWNTAGITGVYGFLKKLWKLYHDESGFSVSDKKASKESLKTLHQTIKKTTEDIQNYSFNTTVSQFMICVNELTAQKCKSREVLEPLAVLISPYAPHIAEELWSLLGHNESIATAAFPEFDEKHLVEDTKKYPISFNGKMRFTMNLPADASREEIQEAVMAHEQTAHHLNGKTPKKVIVVPGKIVNFVV
jgi:leucyl-tRNA synthetase